MQQATTSSPVFEQNAMDLANRLDRERPGHPQAMEMARQARGLITVFRGWAQARPADDVRIKTIGQLFDLHRRAMTLLSTTHAAAPAGGNGSQPGAQQNKSAAPSAQAQSVMGRKAGPG